MLRENSDQTGIVHTQLIRHSRMKVKQKFQTAKFETIYDSPSDEQLEGKQAGTSPQPHPHPERKPPLKGFYTRVEQALHPCPSDREVTKI